MSRFLNNAAFRDRSWIEVDQFVQLQFLGPCIQTGGKCMERMQVDGREVAYRTQGSGATVIAIHCSSSHSGQWKPLMTACKRKYRVIAPDMHGYGQSAPIPAGKGTWFDYDIVMLRAFIDAANGPVHLIGHSLGAALCIMAARENPKVASLCLYEPVLFSLLEEANDVEANEAWWISARVHGLLRVGQRRSAAKHFVDFWSGEGTWDLYEPRVQDYIEATVDRVADDWAGQFLELEGAVCHGDLVHLKIPTLLMRGSKSRASARRIVDHLGDAMPNSDLIELQGMAHMAPVTHTDIVLPRIVGWLERQITKGK